MLLSSGSGGRGSDKEIQPLSLVFRTAFSEPSQKKNYFSANKSAVQHRIESGNSTLPSCCFLISEECADHSVDGSRKKQKKWSKSMKQEPGCRYFSSLVWVKLQKRQDPTFPMIMVNLLSNCFYYQRARGFYSSVSTDSRFHWLKWQTLPTQTMSSVSSLAADWSAGCPQDGIWTHRRPSVQEETNRCGTPLNERECFAVTTDRE